MGSFLGIFALRALNSTFSCGKSLVRMYSRLPNVLGGGCGSNHTILLTQKDPFGSENYFFAFLGQKRVIFGGVPRLQEATSRENNGVKS